MGRGGKREGAGRKVDPESAVRAALSTTMRVHVDDKELLKQIQELALTQWHNPERAGEIAARLVRSHAEKIKRDNS